MSDQAALGCLLLGVAASLAYVLAKRNRYALSVSLLILAVSMFAFTYAGFNGSTPNFWFKRAPPWFVSRIVLASIALIVGIGIWRVRSHWPIPGRRQIALAVIATLMLPATLIPMQMGFAPNVVIEAHNILAFTVMLTAMLYLALILAPLEERLQPTAQGSHSVAAALIVVCAIVSILGFLEVALDIGFIRNMFTAGIVETRASSSFDNPNWFALGLVPFVFAGMHLAMQGRAWSARTLIAFAALGLVVSGSRSVVSILSFSILIFLALAWAGNQATRSAARRSFGTLVTGGVMGLAAGFLAAAALGQVALDRLLTVSIRLIGWPVLLFTQSAVFRAIWGRFDLDTLYGMRRPVGFGIVDSAYLFLFGANPAVLVLLVAFLAIVTWMTVSAWRAQPSPRSCLAVAVCIFVVLIGFAGQVYWAFPVWIVMSVMLAWLLANEDADAEKACPTLTGAAKHTPTEQIVRSRPVG